MLAYGMKWRSVLVVLVGVYGCARPSDENLGLGGRARVVVDVKRLERPAELMKALRLDGGELDAALGARSVTANTSIELESSSRPAELLVETYLLEIDGRGALHLVHDNSHGYGTEAFVSGGELYIRPRYGKFVRRRPPSDEVERLRRAVEDVPGAYLEPLEPWLQLTAAGRGDRLGRASLRFKMSALGAPHRMPWMRRREGQGWRDTVKVRSLDGHIELDSSSGAALEARLEAVYTFERAGAPVTAHVKLSWSTSALAEPIRTPSEFVSSPSRPRPFADRQQLLEGLTGKKPP